MALRLFGGLLLIALALLGSEADSGGALVSALGLPVFAAAYYYCQDHRAVLAVMLSSAVLHDCGPAAGLGAGLAMGLWLWLAFHVCKPPFSVLFGALGRSRTP